MAFRKEPFFYGHDNYDQLVKIAKVRPRRRRRRRRARARRRAAAPAGPPAGAGGPGRPRPPARAHAGRHRAQRARQALLAHTLDKQRQCKWARANRVGIGIGYMVG